MRRLHERPRLLLAHPGKVPSSSTANPKPPPSVLPIDTLAVTVGFASIFRWRATKPSSGARRRRTAANGHPTMSESRACETFDQVRSSRSPNKPCRRTGRHRRRFRAPTPHGRSRSTNRREGAPVRRSTLLAHPTHPWPCLRCLAAAQKTSKASN